MVTYAELIGRKRESTPSYDEEKVMLYALGVGLGLDPLDEQQLEFVTESALQVLPSFATVAAWDIGFTLELGIEWSKLIHAAQHIETFAPMPARAQLRTTTRTLAAFKKRAGTFIVNETDVFDQQTDNRLARLESVSLARDFFVEGTPEGSPPKRHAHPQRPADKIVSIETSPQVALIYRLLGGRSDIHSSPRAARAQGFDGPIMHGLSTWGHACHALLRSECGYDSTRMKSFSARFSAPVYPGERLAVSIWRADKEAFFEVTSESRDVVVLSEGHTCVAPP
ncbi:MAG: 3-alpha,7-alpha,12-alpha-trihydroxy-5-beta-cholest-24-enoyl-CoA hydratase [Gammaproteobacteria bacterium]|nr:3-alpha,7-alpha,12-alpha-trihydroxy-5-beta-cholest-24-enoyl-CoA hydratase [Gammaproteobacteria bacterium]